MNVKRLENFHFLRILSPRYLFHISKNLQIVFRSEMNYTITEAG